MIHHRLAAVEILIMSLWRWELCQQFVF